MFYGNIISENASLNGTRSDVSRFRLSSNQPKDLTNVNECLGKSGQCWRRANDKTNVIVIKGGQLSLQASVIAHCGALVLMCLFCCKQLFFHSRILMITRSLVIFGCHPPLFYWLRGGAEDGHSLIMALEKFSANYSTATESSSSYLLPCFAYFMRFLCRP